MQIPGSDSSDRRLFEIMEEGFISAEVLRDDMAAITDWRYIDVNTALERHTGFRPRRIADPLMY